MYISKLKIKNFKCFDEVEIEFDPNFNLIIGENNSGKSTIFDSLRLWQLAFKEFLKDRTNNQQSSFRVTQNFSFTIDDIAFLRIIDFYNLFKNKSQKKFEITLTISINNEDVSLPIIFISTTKGKVLNFELCKQPNLRLNVSQKISELLQIPLGSDFKELFLFTYINPLFLLPNKEPKYSKGYILNKIHEAKASEIIRNLLYVISPEKKKIKKEIKNDKLIEIENSIKDILKLDDISFLKRLEDEESYIKIYAKNETLNTEVEINQLGSGTINVLNILSVLAYGDYEKINLNALLLDEPDSHLHFNHQNRLYNHLKKVSKDENKQIFIITHNSSLISQFSNVLYIESNKNLIRPITINDYLENHLKDLDEAHYNVIKELNQAKSKLTDLDEKIKEDDRTYLIFEGPTDRNIFKIAFEKLYKNDFPFEIVDTVSSASTLATYLNAHKKKLGFLIGIFDDDHEGRTQFGNLNKVEFQDRYSYKQSGNKYAFLLPTPSYRELPFYKKHLTIEYMFTDHDLYLMLGNEYFIKEEGEEYNKIKGEDNKQAYTIPNKIKTLVSEKCNELPSISFNSFKPFFEEIAKITKIELSYKDA